MRQKGKHRRGCRCGTDIRFCGRYGTGRRRTAGRRSGRFTGCSGIIRHSDRGNGRVSGVTLDNVLHSENNGDIHYNLYVPDSYDGSEPYALFFTLPGYQGLYFQGVGENLYTEDFGFTAQEYNPEMIIVAP